MRTVRGITALFILSLLVNYTLYGTKILISKGNWGDVREDEIHTVLQSATEVFKPYSPILKNNKIRVYMTESYPKIHYDKDEDGFHRIKISAKGRFWCQYVFQFSRTGHLILKPNGAILQTIGSRRLFVKPHRTNRLSKTDSTTHPSLIGNPMPKNSGITE